MIDFVKIYLENINLEKLIYSSGLDFESGISKTTGEIKENLLIAEYHFCKITVKKATSTNPHIIFTGSLHKLWNSISNTTAPNFCENKIYKGFNGNLFNLIDFNSIVSHLENLFDCNASQMRIQNIEFGINANLNFFPNDFLKGLLYHKSNLFDFSHSGNYAQAIHNNYILKIYNKSFQYAMPEKVLRVEVKFVKMIELRDLYIKTLADINATTLKKAKETLLKRFNEVVYYDYTIDKTRLLKREIIALQNYSNPRYWIEDVKPIHRDRPKKRLQDLILKHSQNLHNQIENEIENCVIFNRSSIELNITQDNRLNPKITPSSFIVN